MTAWSTPLGPPHAPITVNTRRGVPVDIRGLSGVAKSERIEAAAKKIGLRCWTVNASTASPEDFYGALVPTPDGVIIECVMDAARKAIEAGEGVIFLDEITTVRPAVQAPMLSFINERRVGSHFLPSRVRITMASNPPEYAVAGFDLAPPMANRMAHRKYVAPTGSEWADWLLGTNQPELPDIGSLDDVVQQNWGEVWSTCMGLFASYMKANSKEIHNQPKPDAEDSGGSWPSHRTWYMLARATATVRALPNEIAPKILEKEFAEALVGKAAAKQWMTYVRNMDLPSPRDMLKNQWRIDENRPDKAFASLASMTAFVTSQTGDDRFELAYQAWKVLQGVIDDGRPDIITDRANDLVKAGFGRKNVPDKVAQAATKVVSYLASEKFVDFL